MERLLRKVKSIAAVLLLVVLTIGPAGAPSCPSMPNAIIIDPPTYNYMLNRIVSATPPFQSDSATTVNVPVWVYASGEYRYKVGADAATNCASAVGYTTWRSSSLNLVADFSASTDGLMELCLLGRRQLSPGVYIQQPIDRATVYKWAKDSTAPGAFMIDDIGSTADTTPTITWEESSGAASYDVKIASNPDCSGVIQSQNNVATNSYTPGTPLADGSFHVCVMAKDFALNETNAGNNGIQGVVGGEVVIEDRIGEPSTTDGKPSLISDESGFSVAATVGKYHVSENVKLTKVVGIGVPYNLSGPTPIDIYGWKIAIHSDENEARNNPANGDILTLTGLPAPTIETAGTNSVGYPNYMVGFDLSAEPGLNNIVLNGGTDYWITILGVSIYNWAWAESETAGDPDTLTIDNEFIFAWTAQPGYVTGRSAIKLIGLPQP